MQRVIILTGPVRSGKTTLLGQTLAIGAAGGVLSPDAPRGRVFVSVATGAVERFEEVREGEPIVTIGRFGFRAAAFDWANAWIAAGANTRRPVVIDEVGPLELRGAGLAAGVRRVLARDAGVAVLVVRQPLLDEVRTAFGLTDCTVATVESWPQLWQAANGTA